MKKVRRKNLIICVFWLHMPFSRWYMNIIWVSRERSKAFGQKKGWSIQRGVNWSHKSCLHVNYLHVDHPRAVINTDEAKHLLYLIYFGELNFHISTLVLLCYIALHVLDSKELGQIEVFTVLEWHPSKPT